MLKFRQVIVGFLLQLVCLLAVAFPQTDKPAQIENFDVSAFVQQSLLKTNQANFRLISDYTYKMRATLNWKSGKTISWLYESYFPSRLNKKKGKGGVIIVLEENGVALSAEKIEKQRREAGKKLEKAEYQSDEKSIALEAIREKGLPLDWTYDAAAVALNTFLEVCKFTAPDREMVDGRETLSLTFNDCSVNNLPETKSYMKNIQGKIWFDAADKIPIRLEAWQKTSSANTVQISPKILVLFEQQRVADGVWFPATIRVEGLDNKTVFPKLKLNWRIELFDYKLPETEVKDVKVNSR